MHMPRSKWGLTVSTSVLAAALSTAPMAPWQLHSASAAPGPREFTNHPAAGANRTESPGPREFTNHPAAGINRTESPGPREFTNHPVSA